MLKQQRVGEPLSYKKLAKPRKPKIKELRGIYKAWLNSPKYLLRLEADQSIRIYVTVDGKLGSKEDAKKFAVGFDDHIVKKDYWSRMLKVKLIVERV